MSGKPYERMELILPNVSISIVSEDLPVVRYMVGSGGVNVC
jgi:hypothetical protein